MNLLLFEGLTSIFSWLLPVHADFAGRVLLAARKRSEIALPATTSGRTSPAGPGGLSSFGALGRVSRSGRFRNRASDPRPRTVRGSTLSRAEASGSGPAAAGRSTGPGGAGFFRSLRSLAQGQRRFGPPGSDRELGQIFSAKYLYASLQQNDGSFPRIAGTLPADPCPQFFCENFML